MAEQADFLPEMVNDPLMQSPLAPFRRDAGGEGLAASARAAQGSAMAPGMGAGGGLLTDRLAANHPVRTFHLSFNKSAAGKPD